MSGIVGSAGSKSGIVMPKVPTFFAYKNAYQGSIHEQNTSGSGYSIVAFESTTIDSHSKFTTGASSKYTIPAGHGGYWQFHVGVLVGSSDSDFKGYQLMLYGGSSAATFLGEDGSRYAGNDIGKARGNLTCIANVAAGDEIQVRIQTNTVSNNDSTVWQSVYSGIGSHMNAAHNRGSIFSGFKLE